MTTLTEQTEQRIAELTRLGIRKGPRCVPRCEPAHWVDLAAVKGTIETVCRRCGAWIGNRPVSGKMGKRFNAESAEDAE